MGSCVGICPRLGSADAEIQMVLSSSFIENKNPKHQSPKKDGKRRNLGQNRKKSFNNVKNFFLLKFNFDVLVSAQFFVSTCV